jgi:hypothetical protein
VHVQIAEHLINYDVVREAGHVALDGEDENGLITVILVAPVHDICYEVEILLREFARTILRVGCGPQIHRGIPRALGQCEGSDDDGSDNYSRSERVVEPDEVITRQPQRRNTICYGPARGRDGV